MTVWEILGIDQTDDTKAIKRAYAVQLKRHRPDSDPEGYQRLRQALDFAIQMARSEQPGGKSSFVANTETEVTVAHIDNTVPTNKAQDEASKAARQAEAAIDDAKRLAASFLTSAGENDLAASNRLPAILADASLTNLDAQRAFEVSLAYGLADWQGNNFPERTCEEIANRLDWPRELSRRSAYSNLLNAVLERLRFARVQHQIVGSANRLGRLWLGKPDELAATVVLNPSAQKAKKKVLGRPAGKKSLRTLLTLLDSFPPVLVQQHFDASHLAHLEQALDKPRIGILEAVASLIAAFLVTSFGLISVANVWLEDSGRYLVPAETMPIVWVVTMVIVTLAFMAGMAYGRPWWRSTEVWRQRRLKTYWRHVVNPISQVAITVSFAIILGLAVLADGIVSVMLGWIFVVAFVLFDPLSWRQTLTTAIVGFLLFFIAIEIVGAVPLTGSKQVLLLVAWLVVHKVSIVFGLRIEELKLGWSRRVWLWLHCIRMGLMGALGAIIAKPFVGV